MIFTIVTRRGKRTKPIYVGKSLNFNIGSLKDQPNGDEKLIRFLQKLIQPTNELPNTNSYYQKLYENLSDAQQKNLIDIIANQILYAHASVVSKALSNLSLFSVDLGQKTEVLLRRLFLERSLNSEA